MVWIWIIYGPGIICILLYNLINQILVSSIIISQILINSYFSILNYDLGYDLWSQEFHLISSFILNSIHIVSSVRNSMNFISTFLSFSAIQDKLIDLLTWYFFFRRIFYYFVGDEFVTNEFGTEDKSPHCINALL